MTLKVISSPGVSKIKEYPCLACGKRFGKPVGMKKGHSHKELMRCMSTISFKYTQAVEELQKIRSEVEEQEKKKGEKIKDMTESEVQATIVKGQEIINKYKSKFNPMGPGKIIIEGNSKTIEKACNVVVEPNTKSSKKESDPSSGAGGGESTKRK